MRQRGGGTVAEISPDIPELCGAFEEQPKWSDDAGCFLIPPAPSVLGGVDDPWHAGANTDPWAKMRTRTETTAHKAEEEEEIQASELGWPSHGGDCSCLEEVPRAPKVSFKFGTYDKDPDEQAALDWAKAQVAAREEAKRAEAEALKQQHGPKLTLQGGFARLP